MIPCTDSRLPRRALIAATAVMLALPAFACTEPRRANQSPPAPTAPLDARLELSDSLAAPGADVIVTVRFTGSPIASATARILYDTTGVTLLGEEELHDGATRVMNAQPGMIRFAGVDASGFAQGRVYAFRFAVRRTASIRALQLVVDEAHTVSRADAAASLSRKP